MEFSKFVAFIESHPLEMLVILIWLLVWKGWALWRAASRGEKWWFIFFLIVNTFGILEILYIYIFSRKLKLDHSV